MFIRDPLKGNCWNYASKVSKKKRVILLGKVLPKDINYLNENPMSKDIEPYKPKRFKKYNKRKRKKFGKKFLKRKRKRLISKKLDERKNPKIYNHLQLKKMTKILNSVQKLPFQSEPGKQRIKMTYFRRKYSTDDHALINNSEFQQQLPQVFEMFKQPTIKPKQQKRGMVIPSHCQPQISQKAKFQSENITAPTAYKTYSMISHIPTHSKSHLKVKSFEITKNQFCRTYSPRSLFSRPQTQDGRKRREVINVTHRPQTQENKNRGRRQSSRPKTQENKHRGKQYFSSMQRIEPNFAITITNEFPQSGLIGLKSGSTNRVKSLSSAGGQTRARTKHSNERKGVIRATTSHSGQRK